MMPIFCLTVCVLFGASRTMSHAADVIGCGDAGQVGDGILQANACSFTMGGTNYTLNSITVRLGDGGGSSPTMGLRIFNDNAGNPGSILIAQSPDTFAPPSPSPADYTYGFSGETLAPSTTYWIVVSRLSGTIGTDFVTDQGGANLITIAGTPNMIYKKTSDADPGTWSWTTFAGYSLVFTLDADPPGGGISLSTNALSFVADYAGSNSPAQTVGMDNLGPVTFTYTNIVSYGPQAFGWLTTDPYTGTLAPSNTTALTSAVSVAGIDAGEYYATNAVTAADATNSPQTFIVTLTVNKADQTIDFPPISDQITTSTPTLSATADSGLPVSFGVDSGPASISGGTNLSFSGTGTVSILASQGGNSNYNAAVSVTNSFEVTKATGLVTLHDLAATYDGLPHPATATTTPTGLTVNITYNGSPAAPVDAGNYTVVGTLDDPLYQGGATDTLVIAKQGQTITFPNPGMQVETNVVALAATADSGLTVAYSVVSGPAVITNTTSAAFTNVGVVTLQADQPGDSNYAAAASETVTFSVRSDRVPFCDFDGDGVSDLTVYEQANGIWSSIQSSDGAFTEQHWGWSEAVPVPADYNGDGSVENAVFHPAYGMWYLRRPDGSVRQQQFGWHATEPVPGDYNGDGSVDFAVYLPEGGMWYVLDSRNGVFQQQQFGWRETIPVPGDYDGDGTTDFAVYYPAGGAWYVLNSAGFYTEAHLGWSESQPAPGDFDGDGHCDQAVYHQAKGMWYVLLDVGTGASRIQQFGWYEVRPVVGDFDGDGTDDIGVYHPEKGRWSVQGSGSGFATDLFGWREAVPPVTSYWRD